MDCLIAESDITNSIIALRTFHIFPESFADSGSVIRSELSKLAEPYFCPESIKPFEICTLVTEILDNIEVANNLEIDQEIVAIRIYFSVFDMKLIIQFIDKNTTPVPHFSSKTCKIVCPPLLLEHSRGTFMTTYCSDYFCRFHNPREKRNYHILHFNVDIIPGDSAHQSINKYHQSK